MSQSLVVVYWRPTVVLLPSGLAFFLSCVLSLETDAPKPPESLRTICGLSPLSCRRVSADEHTQATAESQAFGVGRCSAWPTAFNVEQITIFGPIPCFEDGSTLANFPMHHIT